MQMLNKTIIKIIIYCVVQIRTRVEEGPVNLTKLERLGRR